MYVYIYGSVYSPGTGNRLECNMDPAPGIYLESLRNPAIDYKMSASQSVIELSNGFYKTTVLFLAVLIIRHT